jgi:hypothetical protein
MRAKNGKETCVVFEQREQRLRIPINKSNEKNFYHIIQKQRQAVSIAPSER